ncbi:MAG: metallophosphoesterase [Thermoproteota archaeon]|nr:metallophosphoesterase [Candidatus Korarchaeota archaeon]RLG41141.1 MAG: metallophosphoesterase [Candidatus Korarchaeota archaeon]
MPKTRIFFTSDLHGSERCFLKFLNTPKFYKADVLIIGGDITGKVVIPVFRDSSGKYRADFLGEKHEVSESKLEDLLSRIRGVGYYPYVTTEDEWSALTSDPKKMEEVLVELEVDTLRRWVELAEEKLKDLRGKVKVFIMPGNDDRYEIDEVLDSSDFVINPDGKVVMIDEEHEMLGIGNSNITPWRCPRDVPEEKLAKKIEELASKIENLEKSIFTIHVPPYGSGLDIAPKLDDNLKPVLSPGGGPMMVPVGSTAVRDAIKKYQPMLGLHGHIHESRGAIKIGRTLCINPGSEYGEGILRGVLIDIEGNRIKDYLLTSG